MEDNAYMSYNQVGSLLKTKETEQTIFIILIICKCTQQNNF